MPNRIEAIDAAKDLALEGLSAAMIRTKLEERGFGGLLEQEEIESIITEIVAVRNLVPQRPSRIWPRVVGVIAILMGLGGIALGGSQSARYSPNGYGLWAVILGIVLVIKPGWSNEDIR